MAIVDLDKVTLYGMSRQKLTVVEGLQQLGCAHVVTLRQTSGDLPKFVSKEARLALGLMKGSPIQRDETVWSTDYDGDQVVDETLRVHDQRQELTAERDQLESAVAELKPWGDFLLPETNDFDGSQFFFYVVAPHEISQLPGELVWQVVNQDNRFAYVVVISIEEPTEMPGRRVELDRRPLSQLSDRLIQVRERLEDLKWRLVSLTRWRRLLQQDLDRADDMAAQAATIDRMIDDDSVFALQAWVPHRAIPDVRRLAAQHQLAITFSAPEPTDTPPTLLDNPKRVAGAEGCVTFYMTPGYHAWDPTSVVYFSLSLFFAMIVSDAGYGLVMLGIVALLWRTLGRSTSGAIRYLLLGIVAATIGYGVLVGSYFGLAPTAGGILDSLRLRINGQPMMNNQNAMMVIAVAIGVGHLTLANIISAWNSRQSSRWIGHAGWAGVMVGAFLVGSGAILDLDSLNEIGTLLLIPGAVAALCFSSDEPVIGGGFQSLLRRLLDGLFQIANVPKAFGDTLSYLRLFALGLASAQLAVTFNGLAGDAFAAGGVGVLAGLVILTIGHGINFLLALMGGVVHGLRLNCIEFFNWSLTEEGYPFQPFERKAEY